MPDAAPFAPEGNDFVGLFGIPPVRPQRPIVERKASEAEREAAQKRARRRRLRGLTIAREQRCPVVGERCKRTGRVWWRDAKTCRFVSAVDAKALRAEWLADQPDLLDSEAGWL